MITEVRIGNEGDVQLVLDEPRFNAEGWMDAYRISVVSRKLNAEVVVDNAPYGESVVDYFGLLHENWKGWDGEKSWYALEGEYSCSATMSRTGHLTLVVHLNVQIDTLDVNAKFDIEAGQLDGLERKMRQFFGYKQRL